MGVRYGVLVAAAAVGAMTLPSSAATPTVTRLSVASSGNGVVTIHLPRAVDLTESVSLAGVGHYRAAAIFPLGKATAHAGPVIVYSDAGAFAGRSRLGYVGDHGKTRLPAGDYRVYLASDQPMTLRWSVLGPSGRRATGRTPAACRSSSRTPDRQHRRCRGIPTRPLRTSIGPRA